MNHLVHHQLKRFLSCTLCKNLCKLFIMKLFQILFLEISLLRKQNGKPKTRLKMIKNISIQPRIYFSFVFLCSERFEICRPFCSWLLQALKLIRNDSTIRLLKYHSTARWNLSLMCKRRSRYTAQRILWSCRDFIISFSSGFSKFRQIEKNNSRRITREFILQRKLFLRIEVNLQRRKFRRLSIDRIEKASFHNLIAKLTKY